MFTDITPPPPRSSLHTFHQVPRFRVLVCGGDGTVGWVLGVLEAIRHKLVCREPPIGIVPLGTGESVAVMSSPCSDRGAAGSRPLEQ